MKTALSQEFYKLVHNKLTWWTSLLIVPLMLTMPMTFKDTRWLIMANFGSSQWILLVLIIVGATLFSMETQYNTILMVLYKAPSRLIIYIAKFIILCCYDLSLHLFALILTILFKMLAIGGQTSWGAIYQYQQSLIINTFTTSIIDISMSLMVIALLFLLSCLIDSNAIVIATSIVIVFMGQILSSILLHEQPEFVNWLKWNPFNMLNLTFQYANYPVYHKLTQLATNQLLVGTLCYTLLFLWLGNTCFKRRHF